MDFNLLKAAAPLIMGAVAYCGAQMAAASLADWAEGWAWLKRVKGFLAKAGWVLTLVLIGFGLTQVLGLDTRLVPAGIVLTVTVQRLVALVRRIWKGCLITTILLLVVVAVAALNAGVKIPYSELIGRGKEAISKVDIDLLTEGKPQPEATEEAPEAEAVEAEAVEEPAQSQIEATEPAAEATAEATEATPEADVVCRPSLKPATKLWSEPYNHGEHQGEAVGKASGAVELLGKSSNLSSYKVRLEDGTVGWVEADALVDQKVCQGSQLLAPMKTVE